MKSVPRMIPAVMLVGLALVLASGTAFAQDPLKVAPKNYKVILENEHVRVLEFHSKAGEKIAMHSHPAYVVYAMSSVKTKHTSPDGKTSERESKAGQAAWSDAETHTSEVVGPGDAHAILIEMKHAPAPAKPKGAEKKAPAKKM